jgi:hypothetical protein
MRFGALSLGDPIIVSEFVKLTSFFLSSRSEARRNIPRTTIVAPAKMNSQTYRVSIISSYANFVVADSQIFSKPFLE